MSGSKRVSRRGIAASPGVGIGPAYVVDRRQVQLPRTHIAEDAVADEVARFRKALRASQEQLEAIKTRLPHGEHRQILQAQQMMLRDPDLIAQTEALIRADHINAEWAVARTTDDIRDTLGAAEEEYFRERQFDVAFLSARLLRNLHGAQTEEISPPEDSVLVAHDLSPADTAHLHHHGVQGIVTELGGPTSHSAIMARALEIPAVVGVDELLRDVETGDTVIVDAVHGTVLIRPTDEEIDDYRGIAARYHEFEDEIHKERALPAVTKDGRRVALRANIALTEELDYVRTHGAEGVGLYRTEYMFLNRDRAPTEEEHYRAAKKVLQSVAPYPVVFRTFDLGSDKRCELFPQDEIEANPALGVRSLRLALRARDHFLAQLRGLLRAALHGPLRIMLPLVSGLDELRQGLAAVDEARAQLEESGLAYAEAVPVGIMIEVPAAAIIADVLARHVDFMSIGTNDLIQYTMAIDRDNDEVGYLYEPLHPAILRMIRNVAQAGRDHDVPVSLCGEMGSDPLYTWVLVGLGLRELSAHPASVPVLKSMLRQSDTKEIDALAEAVLQAESVSEARARVGEAMRERFPEHLLHGGAAELAESSTS